MNAPLIPDIDVFEERAAIAQYEGGLTRKQAENLAAKAQGFQNADHYWQWLAEYVLRRGGAGLLGRLRGPEPPVQALL